MRCRRREGPWGFHHVEARALKWEISLGETDGEDEEDARWFWKWHLTKRGAVRRRRLRLRGDVGERW